MHHIRKGERNILAEARRHVQSIAVLRKARILRSQEAPLRDAACRKTLGHARGPYPDRHRPRRSGGHLATHLLAGSLRRALLLEPQRRPQKTAAQTRTKGGKRTADPCRPDTQQPVTGPLRDRSKAKEPAPAR